MPKLKIQSGPRAKREARLLRNAQAVKSRREDRDRSTKFDEALAFALENAPFELPPIDDIIKEAAAAYNEHVQDHIKKLSLRTEFEIVHALMVYFYNRKPVRQTADWPNSAISMLAARNIERRMRDALATPPSHKTIFDNFQVAPESAERVTRRLRNRQLMLAFFAQWCGAVGELGKPLISEQELDRAKRALAAWDIEVTAEEIARHFSRAQETLAAKKKATPGGSRN